MGREQGDHLGEIETTWYVGKVNGVEHERPASAPAEHINLRARGWVTKESLGRANEPEGVTGTPTTSPSGSSGESTPASSAASSPSTSTEGQQTSGTAPATAKRGGRPAPDVQSAAPQDGVAAGTE